MAIETAGQQKYADLTAKRIKSLQTGMIVWISLLCLALICSFDNIMLAAIIGCVGIVLAVLNTKARKEFNRKLDRVKDKEEFYRQLAAPGQLETVDILKVAHHGSRYSSSSEFLAQATPAVSLISCSATNRYGHPGQETLERLQTEKSAVRITKNCGAICLWTDGSVIKLKTVK